MTINTIIIDNDPAWSSTLRTDLQLFPEISVIDTIFSIETLKKEILELQPFLLFINMEMSRMDSMELLLELRAFLHPGACIVFYCADNKYMIDAVRASAFDYLPKPYPPEELALIVERVKRKHKCAHNNLTLSDKLISDDRKFALRTVTGLLLVKRSEVVYFQHNEALRCWQIHLTGDRTSKLRSYINAKNILDLSPSLFQVNQFVIINIDYLDSIDSQMHCTFIPPIENLDVSFSRRYYQKLKDTMEIV